MYNKKHISAGKPEEKRPVGKYRNRWEDNIKMHLKEAGCEVVNLIHLADDRGQWLALVNTIISLWVL
jgi:hypothetical protein